MANAKMDENSRATLIALSNVGDGAIVDLWADPTTHRLLVDLAAGSGTVTSVSVVSANGLAGTVATSTTTPAITLSTTITGILEGNGTAISAASTTGSGNVVLATSPTLVTPALGTPSALVGTNITGTGAGFTAGAVSTITGLAPDTATTQATQGNITSAANLVTVGALNSGSITSGFGAINNGASNITTTGAGSLGTLSVGNTIITNGNGLIIGNNSQITTHTAAEFQLLGTSGADSSGIFARFSDDIFQPTIEFVKSRGTTIGSATIVEDNDVLGGIHWHPADGINFDNQSAAFSARVDDASPAEDDIGTEFVWDSMPGGGGAIRNVMTLSAAGNLTVNTGGLTLNGPVFIEEQAEADADVAGQGQIWVDTITPNELKFTDDTGVDYNLSKSSIRWLVFNLVEAATDVVVASNIAGDFVSPIAGTILQSDSTPFYLYATNSTAGVTGTTVVDISINGTSIMTTNKLDFDTTEKTTTTAATPPDLTTTALAVGDIITIDVDSVASGTTPKGLTVYMATRE